MTETSIIVGGIMCGVFGFFLGIWVAWPMGRSRQSASARGGSVVIQSGCKVAGDLVGGDLVKGGTAAQGRCKYCGAAP